MIKLIVLDIDGCMSDGKLHYTDNGNEIKSFNVKDGLAITSWHKLGMKSAIITGRESTIIKKRADELSIEFVYQGIKNKELVLQNIVKELNISLSEVASIGDDLNDIKMLKMSGISFCPSDANSFVKNSCKYILNKNGGDGAVREMIEKILTIDSKFEDFIGLWS